MLESGYAAAFDVIYHDEAALAMQIAFLESCFRDRPGLLLDAGCGTGRHLRPLRRRGWPIIGVDFSPAMLAAAHPHLTAAGSMTALVCGDLRALPFRPGFAGILCMDSPLALLREDADLAAALAGFRRMLRPGGVLVAEVYDYVGSLGEAGIAPWTGRFPAPWGHVIVYETHHYDRDTQCWEMTQRFTLHRAGQPKQFTTVHRLRIRTVDTYVAAIERAGFRVCELLTGYPGAPAAARTERRMIFVASH